MRTNYEQIRKEFLRLFFVSWRDYKFIDLKLLEIETRRVFLCKPFDFWEIIKQFDELDYITHALKEKTTTYEEKLKVEKINIGGYYPRKWEYSIPRNVIGTEKIKGEYENSQQGVLDYNYIKVEKPEDVTKKYGEELTEDNKKQNSEVKNE